MISNDLIAEIVDRVRAFNQPVRYIYMNGNTYDALMEQMEVFDDEKYFYYLNLGFRDISVVVDNALKDGLFELR